jgi:anion-transporting  ArsA/GET3 family ATPase
MLFVSPFERTFLFVTGKGGVGKTTVSASLARALSLSGRRTLLAVTDPAPYAALFPQASWLQDPAALEERLFTVHIQSQAALKEYGRLLIKPRLARQALFENKYVQGFLAAVPGLPQWAVLGKAWYHTSERVGSVPRFDTVIFDAPATGHGFEMLRLPKAITEVAPAGLLRRDAELAWDMLRDPARSTVVVVTLPEELPTNETLELSERIRNEIGIDIGSIVLNRVRPQLFDAEERALLVPMATPLETVLDHALAGTTEDEAELGLQAAATRAIREQVQIDSIARLRGLSKPLFELPEVDPLASAEVVLETLCQSLLAPRA